MPTCAELQANDLLRPFPPKAAQLIVTIYGDIVEPRGGVLWMGDLISLCAGFGVNESLVRTAVSRLVSKEQLSGQRDGRRSFYALTPAARDEYHLAAELFYGPEDGECDWIITHCPDPRDQSALMRHGFACLGGDIHAGADRPGRPIFGTAFRSVALQPKAGDLKALLNAAFDLGALSDDYSGFVSRFRGMSSSPAERMTGEAALLLRLALVHAYRAIRLRDPRLPPSVLPRDWPGFEAHRLFAERYLNLSASADAHIGRHLLNQDGLLPEKPEAVEARLISLTARR